MRNKENSDENEMSKRANKLAMEWKTWQGSTLIFPRQCTEELRHVMDEGMPRSAMIRTSSW